MANESQWPILFLAVRSQSKLHTNRHLVGIKDEGMGKNDRKALHGRVHVLDELRQRRLLQAKRLVVDQELVVLARDEKVQELALPEAAEHVAL